MSARSWAGRSIILAGLAAALAVVAYQNGLNNPFVYDDQTEVLRNESIEDLSNLGAIVRHSLTRPVVNLSYAVDYAIWGFRDEYGFHLTNLILHIVNVLLFYALVRLLVAQAWRDNEPSSEGVLTMAAFAAAGLFAVHPLLTETVGYVASRSEILGGLFVLLAMHAFVRVLAQWSVAGLLLGILAFALALASKETGAMLPVLVIAWDLFVVRERTPGFRSRVWRLHAPLFAVVLIGGAVRVWLYTAVENPHAAGFNWPNVLRALHAVASYPSLLFFPVGQTLVHPSSPIQSLADWRLLETAAVFATAFWIIVATRRRLAVVAFGVVWFFALLVPSSVLILLSAMGQPFAEHRVYLSSCGAFLAIGAATAQACAARASRTVWTAAGAVLLAVLVVLGTLTVQRNRVWSDPVSLWSEAVSHSPRTPIAHYMLGDALRVSGDCTAAEAAYREAISLGPTAVQAYLGLARCLLVAGQVQAAASTLRLAILEVPTDAEARVELASIEAEHFGDVATAARLCREAADRAPNPTEGRACAERYERRLAVRQRP